MDIYEVVIKLVGSITPVGSSGIDNDRYKNLEIMIELVDKLISDIDCVAYDNKDCYQHSMKIASDRASKALDDFGIKE